MTRMINLAALAAGMPLAVACLPRGDSNDPARALRDLEAAIGDFRNNYDARLSTLQSSIDDLARTRAVAGLNGLGPSRPADPEYTGLFASYLRTGEGEDSIRRANAEGFRSQIRAAMSGDSGAAGGYLAPTEWDRQVLREQVFVSPMRRLATVIATGVGAYSTVWNDGAWVSGWVGETEARPATASPTLHSLEFGHGEVYSNVPVSQNLLDDASFDLEAWLVSEISTEFGLKEGTAFISGDGVKKPFGILSYVTGGAAAGRHPGGNLTVVNSGAAADIAPDKLVDFAYSLPAPYRQGAGWLMNSTTAAYISKLKNGAGDYLWREGLAAGQPATLLGYPVEIDEAMPNFAANALAIAFGNFRRGYVINDRLSVSILRDPYTNKPYVNFYGRKRVGGGVVDPKAIRLLKVAV